MTAYVVGFILLFILSGIGNGSTYKMIPSIFEAKAQGQDEWSRDGEGGVVAQHVRRADRVRRCGRRAGRRVHQRRAARVLRRRRRSRPPTRSGCSSASTWSAPSSPGSCSCGCRPRVRARHRRARRPGASTRRGRLTVRSHGSDRAHGRHGPRARIAVSAAASRCETRARSRYRRAGHRPGQRGQAAPHQLRSAVHQGRHPRRDDGRRPTAG